MRLLRTVEDAGPYKMGALNGNKSNIGERAGSRWSLTAMREPTTVSVETTPTFAPNYGTGQSITFYIPTSP
jgi:hypothetical protein